MPMSVILLETTHNVAREIATNNTFIVSLFMFTLTIFILIYNEGKIQLYL